MIQPYLFFNGRCDEAIAFYRDCLGAEVEFIMRFKDSPDPLPSEMPDDWGEKVMHTTLRIGECRIMASDGCESGKDGFKGFALSFILPNESEAARVFGLLLDGGSVQMQIGKTFWSPCFGMVQDKFGIHWMITVPETGQPQR